MVASMASSELPPFSSTAAPVSIAVFIAARYAASVAGGISLRSMTPAPPWTTMDHLCGELVWEAVWAMTGRVAASSRAGAKRARSIMRGILNQKDIRSGFGAEAADVRAEALQFCSAHAMDSGQRGQISGPRMRDGSQNAVAEDEECGLAFLLRNGEPPLLESFFERSALGCKGGKCLLRNIFLDLCRLAALRGIPCGTLAQGNL